MRTRAVPAGQFKQRCLAVLDEVAARELMRPLALPSFIYAAGRDPLDGRTLEAIAIGVTTQNAAALDPLPTGIGEGAISKSSLSHARCIAQARTGGRGDT